MNRETRKVIDFINDTPEYTNKVQELRKKFSNHKDFSNQVLYLVQEILNTQKKFYDYPRHKIDLFVISNIYF